MRRLQDELAKAKAELAAGTHGISDEEARRKIAALQREIDELKALVEKLRKYKRVRGAPMPVGGDLRGVAETWLTLKTDVQGGEGLPARPPREEGRDGAPRPNQDARPSPALQQLAVGGG